MIFSYIRGLRDFQYPFLILKLISFSIYLYIYLFIYLSNFLDNRRLHQYN
jgi:hypothetical protein